MGVIKKLSDDVSQKIAAGEVIERPASVVKELVENCLDAQATDIRVELLAGGKGLIRVADNGVGMSREDALLSFESLNLISKRIADTNITETGYFFVRESFLFFESIARPGRPV